MCVCACVKLMCTCIHIYVKLLSVQMCVCVCTYIIYMYKYHIYVHISCPYDILSCFSVAFKWFPKANILEALLFMIVDMFFKYLVTDFFLIF